MSAKTKKDSKAAAKSPAKAAKPAKEAKEAKEKPAAKMAKEAKAKPAGKAAKGAKGAATDDEEAVEGAPQVDLDELEEQEDEAASAASGGNSNAAALAAASGGTEISASFKNFRHHPDMENFYRFIYENDLRHEALAIIDVIQADKLEKRAQKAPGKGAH